MTESQTLVLTLLTIKTENSLTRSKGKTEKNLLIMCKGKEKLQEKACEPHCKRLRKQELARVLHAHGDVHSSHLAMADALRSRTRLSVQRWPPQALAAHDFGPRMSAGGRQASVLRCASI